MSTWLITGSSPPGATRSDGAIRRALVRLARLLLYGLGMTSEGSVRFEHRGYLVEITLSQNPDGTWNGDWAVFQREPFSAVGAGMLGVPAKTLSAAETAARRSATRWVDCYVSAGADIVSARAKAQ